MFDMCKLYILHIHLMYLMNLMNLMYLMNHLINQGIYKYLQLL